MPSRKDLANAIRLLALDAVEKANSGHPGMPMGMADIAEVLWRDFLKHNPKNPTWINRDRFVLSNGHGSMLLYALLHLTGYAISIDDLKQFRQRHSHTPGHPEYDIQRGVECTTGPLGQGIGFAVGMAIAERTLAAEFNREGLPVVDHFTYVFMGDGDLMEGASHEACSLAGTLGLGKLIAFWDDNGVSIDGQLSTWFSENPAKRFEAYGWQVIADVDGHDPDQVAKAIQAAKTNTQKPTLICCKTLIGYGSPKLAGTAKAHSDAMGSEEIAATRKALNWPHAPFVIPQAIYAAWDAKEKGRASEAQWQALFARYQQTYPQLASELMRRTSSQLPAQWEEYATHFCQRALDNQTAAASRKYSQQVLTGYISILPELLGGSADLSTSNGTLLKNSVAINQQQAHGNYLHYGVREFGMSTIMNGIALHGGFIPYGGTFLTFSDYSRNAIRLAALMKLRTIFVFSHDSIGLGEDGPTHQPIEQLTALRAMPNLSVWRPASLAETAVAWKLAIENRHKPTALIFSRQTIPVMTYQKADHTIIAKGAYIIKDSPSTPEVIIIATGSEVPLALAAANQLNEHAVRVVSMPSCDRFDEQETAYQQHVLPSTIRRRLAIEAGASSGWYRYVGLDGIVIGMDHFGESAPGDEVMAAAGFTVENVVDKLRVLLN